MKQENPSLSVGAMARQLSSAWKLMTPEQKAPYDEMAERDKQRSVSQSLHTSSFPAPALVSKGSPDQTLWWWFIVSLCIDSSHFVRVMGLLEIFI